jgi:hypothetical protein
MTRPDAAPDDDHGPDYDHGYVRVPLSIWAALYCQAPLTRRQLQLVSHVLRESWGWQTKDGQVYRWTRPLTPRRFSAATGLSTDHLTQDLRILVARGLLREAGRRYQLVPDPALWKTHPSRAPKSRAERVQTAADIAKTALLPSAVKKAKKEQRNVPRSPESELSPSGDNSLSRVSASDAPPDRSRAAVRAPADPGVAEPLVRLIESFVGPLSPREAGVLRAWIAAAGVVPVWDALEPSFRQGAPATRRQLQRLLRERGGTPKNEISSFLDKEAHA